MITIEKYSLLKLLGMAFFTQARTALIGGSISIGLFESTPVTGVTLATIASNTFPLYMNIILQMVTALGIIILGVALYLTTIQMSKTWAIIALCFYILEAVMLTVSQVFVFALSETSQLFFTRGDTTLISLSNILLACKSFRGKMAMIPFGLGAIIFYYLLMKTLILPKWLALWGMITVSIVLLAVALMALGAIIPFVLLIPYVPFEFFTGIFIVIKYRKKAFIKTEGFI